MKHFYMYFALFDNEDFDFGLFRTKVDLMEGDTEGNVETILIYVLDQHGYKWDNVVKYGLRAIPPDFIGEMVAEGSVHRPGDERAGPDSLPDTGNSDGEGDWDDDTTG